MKQIFFVLAVVAALAASAELKFAKVDMVKLVKCHPNYDSNKALLTSTEKDYQKKLDGMKDDVQKIQEEGRKLAEEARNPMLAAAAKQKLEKDMGDIQNRFLAAQQKLRAEAMRSEQDLRDLEARLLRTTSEDLRKRVAKYAEGKGYDIVLDASAAIYAKDSYDITAEIMNEMGVQPPKKDESK